MSEPWDDPSETDIESMELIRDIKKRANWEESELLERCIERVVVLTNRVEELGAFNKEMRIVIERQQTLLLKLNARVEAQIKLLKQLQGGGGE
jgi:hypothetical protein